MDKWIQTKVSTPQHPNWVIGWDGLYVYPVFYHERLWWEDGDCQCSHDIIEWQELPRHKDKLEDKNERER